MSTIWVCWAHEGDPSHETKHFVNDTLSLGRDLSCEIRLKGWGIARHHAELRTVDGQVFVHDCGSFSGLKVNDERVRNFGPLIEQDLVQIGAYRLWIERDPNRAGRSPAFDAAIHTAAAEVRSVRAPTHLPGEPRLPSASVLLPERQPTLANLDLDRALPLLPAVGAYRLVRKEPILGDGAGPGDLCDDGPGGDGPRAPACVHSTTPTVAGWVALETFDPEAPVSPDPEASATLDPVASANLDPGAPGSLCPPGLASAVSALRDTAPAQVEPAWAPSPQSVGWLRAAAFSELDRRGLRLGDQGVGELAGILRDICRAILTSAAARNALSTKLTADQEEVLVRITLEECLGFGPIQPLMDGASVDEIMVNGPAQIFVERGGVLARCDQQFSSESALRLIAERIASRAGKRLDTAAPTMDARLPDGSRVNLVIPPLALRGTHMTIRKFSRRILSFEHLVDKGSASTALCAFLQWAVEARLNILVSGGTGSGKTTLLNILGSQISPFQRIITIEDAAELALGHPHCVGLEARLAGYEGVGEISIRELLRNALRMRPDRIIIGECRGGEALDLLQALNTGHAGSMSTIHANSPRDALARLEVLTLLSGIEIPISAIRSQIASAFNLVVQIVRSDEGKRTISAVSELSGLEGGSFRMQDIFLLDAAKERGAPRYALCTGVPACLRDRASQGSDHILQIFSHPEGARAMHAVPRAVRASPGL